MGIWNMASSQAPIYMDSKPNQSNQCECLCVCMCMVCIPCCLWWRCCCLICRTVRTFIAQTSILSIYLFFLLPLLPLVRRVFYCCCHKYLLIIDTFIIFQSNNIINIHIFEYVYLLSYYFIRWLLLGVFFSVFFCT